MAMRDPLNQLFRQRFQGHESPVDPGVWEAIQSRLAAEVPASDAVNEVFRQRFQGHELPVDPAVWKAISAQLGHPAGGLFGGALGWAAAGAGALIVAGSIYLLTVGTGPEQVVAVQPVEANAGLAQPQAARETDDRTAPDIGAGVAPQPAAAVQRLQPSSTGVAPATAEGNTAPADVQAKPEPAQPVDGQEVVERIIGLLTTEVEREVNGEGPPAVAPTRPNRSALHVENPAEPVTDGALAEPSPGPLPEIFLQNTFSPNGDGVNDTYEVKAEGFARMLVKIFSVRTNQLVFQTTSNEAWTGANCEDGYYVVAVEALTPDGRMVTAGKVVWLNRQGHNN
jgi:hypothetical protein